MLKRLLYISMCGIILNTLFADTIPGGDVSGTWYAANSPYYITGNITIPADDTLNIEPGVSVNFLGNYGLVAIGMLEAIGTESDSIYFFSEDTVTGWLGIDLQNITIRPYLLSHCTFSYAICAFGTFDGLGPVAYLSNCCFRHNVNAIRWFPDGFGDLHINNCTFRENGPASFGAAIYIALCQGSVDITQCLFENNAANINGGAVCFYYWYSTAINIADCVFRGNIAGNMGGAIYCYHTDDSVVVANSIFVDNECHGTGYYDGGGAITANHTDFSISYSSFYGNDGFRAGAINLDETGASNQFTLDHCTISGIGEISSGTTVFVGEYSSMAVTNSIFAHCNYAIEVSTGTLTGVEYSDYYDNYADINPPSAAPPGFGVLTETNHNGDSCDIYFNIFMDPMFEDTANGNYHLTPGSPCIDAGDPVYPLDPDSTFTEIGAFWFDQTGIKEYPIIERFKESSFLGATVFRGALQLPEGRIYKVFDITGRCVEPEKIKPGIYFVEIDNEIVQKVIKVR